MEIWLAVVGYEGSYQVSSLGRVRSIARLDSSGNRRRMRILRPKTSKYGYRQQILCDLGIIKHKKVATIVAEAFLGPRPPGMVVCHCNGVRGDDRAANLRWDTPKANNADMFVHGTALFGEKHPNAKYCYGDVERARDLSTLGYGAHRIGGWLHMPWQTVAGMIAHSSWSRS